VLKFIIVGDTRGFEAPFGVDNEVILRTAQEQIFLIDLQTKAVTAICGIDHCTANGGQPNALLHLQLIFHDR
jgi:hypothetical protein